MEAIACLFIYSVCLYYHLVVLQPDQLVKIILDF